MIIPILIALILWGVYSVVTFNYAKPDKAPKINPSYVPFIGSIVPFGMDLLGFMNRGREKYGGLWTTKLMGNRVTMVAHKDLHESFFKPRNEILSPHEVYKFMKPVFGPGVVYDATPARMREQLTFVANQLSTAHLKNCVPMIQNQVRKYLNDSWGESGTVNLLSSMASLLISTASLCLFGEKSLDMISPDRFAHLLHEIEAGINPVAVFIHWLPSFGLFRQRVARQEFETLARNILEHQRNIMKQNGRYSEDTEPADIIEALLLAVYRDGTPMTDEERVGIMLGVLFAGQHTSLITSSWALLYLSDPKYKHMKERHTEEYLAHVHKEGGLTDLDFEGLNGMSYTESVVKEVLRLHPPLIMLMRKVLQPLPIGDYVVPEGDTLAISPLASMRSSDIFENPNEFDPTRWCERNEGTGPFDFLAFGAGAHRCLGARFGLLQTQVVLSTILNDYDIELVNGSVPPPDYTTMVVGPTESMTMIRYRKK